jgi:hypothetical protein
MNKYSRTLPKRPDIKVKDRVKQLRDKYFHKKGKLKAGTVTEVSPLNLANPSEEHGTVEVLFDDGELEHYTHYNWHELLRIISDE